jgi:predicted PurR-regulated permease PerM
MSEQKDERRGVEGVAETAAAAVAAASWPQTRAVLRLIFIILAVAGAMWALYMLEGVLLLVVLSVFFAYLVAPLVEFFHRPFILGGRARLMPRTAAISIVYVLIFGSLGLSVYLLLPQIGNQFTELRGQAPGYYKGISERVQSLNRLFERLPAPARDSVKETVGQTVTTVGDYVQATAVSAATFALSHGFWLFLIPILAFFLLKDADSFRRSALRMLPRGRLRWRGDEFFQDVNSALAAYIRAQLIACLLIGVVCTVGFIILGVPYAYVLGIVAGVFEFIPLAGPLAVGILAAVVASFHSFGTAVGVVVFLVVLRIVHDYVTYPRIIGSGIHLHPLAVILAILCGAELAGIAGIFLAIPVIAVVSVSYRHWMEHRGQEEGIVATLLQPAEEAVTAPPTGEDKAARQVADEGEAAAEQAT